METNFSFWWSIVSTILGIILLCVSIAQYYKNRNQEEKIKAQVKVWMQDANRISLALKKIVSDNLAKRYSSTNDVCNAVWAVESSTFALFQSLYEERCVTEEEYKARQKKIADEIEKRQFMDVGRQKITNNK